jgi:hypothetical protein
MTIDKGKKLNSVLAAWPRGRVVTSKWLKDQGVSDQLASQYVRSGWIRRLGRGAYVLPEDPVTWEGAVATLQQQLALSIHPGGPTALAMKGYAHYISFADDRRMFLFGQPGEKLPAWFYRCVKRQQFVYLPTTLFGKATIGLSEAKKDTVSLTVSGPERAMLELAYLVPKYTRFQEALLIMESLTALRPKLVQPLLECCRSVKAKRVFLFLAEQCRHAWLDKLDLNSVDLGHGRRVLAKEGRYDPKYQITVPKDLLSFHDH